MKTAIYLLLIVVCVFPMVHSESPFPVLVIRENELGAYDTLHDSVRTVFDFDNKFVVDGRNYPKPKYTVIIGGN